MGGVHNVQDGAAWVGGGISDGFNKYINPWGDAEEVDKENAKAEKLAAKDAQAKEVLIKFLKNYKFMIYLILRILKLVFRTSQSHCFANEFHYVFVKFQHQGFL